MSDEPEDGGADKDNPLDDLESRELCPDGSCVGVLGSDGKCRVCGGSSDAAPRDEGDDFDEGMVADAESAPAFDDDRALCPDGACIGVLGSDGKCKECGRSAALDSDGALS